MASGGEGAPGLLAELWDWLLLLVGAAIAWIYRAVDTHGRRLESHAEQLRSHSARMDSIKQHAEKIDRIADDVAYIRGRLDNRGPL